MGIPNSWSEQWKSTEDSKTLTELEQPFTLEPWGRHIGNTERLVIPVEEFLGQDPFDPETREYNTTMLEFRVPAGMGQWFYQQLQTDPNHLTRLIETALSHAKTSDTTTTYDTAQGSYKKDVLHFGHDPIYGTLEGKGLLGHQRYIQMPFGTTLSPDFFDAETE